MLLCFTACRRHSHVKQLLLKADSLSYVTPKQTLHILDSFQPQVNEFPINFRMQYHLLHARAKDKAYMSIADDTIMHEVARFYRRHGSANQAMEATYLLGGVYRDRAESLQALDVYQKATELADTTLSDCDYDLLARIHGQMAKLFENQYLLEEELEELDKAKFFSLKMKDTVTALTWDIQKTIVYRRKQCKDSVINLSERIYQTFLQINLPENAYFSISPAILYYIERGELKKAKYYLDLLEGNFSNPFNYTPQQLSGFYMLKALFATSCNQPDSAKYYFHKEVEVFPSANAKAHAYEGLMKIYEKEKQLDSVSKYAQLSMAYNDSNLMELNSESHIKIQALYNYSRFQRIAQDKALHAQRLQNVILNLIIFTFIIVVLFLYGIKKIKTRSNQQLLSVNKKYTAVLEKYSNSLIHLQQLELTEADNQRRIVEKESVIQRLLNEIENYEQQFQLTIHKESISQIISNQQIITLHKKSSMGLKATDAELSEIRELAFKFFPLLLSKLVDNGYPIGSKPTDVCVLLKLGFIPAEIAGLLCTSIQNVGNIRSRIYKKLTGKAGTAKEFDRLISQMN